MEPVAYRVLLALKARLQQITVANGFRTDAGLNVFLGNTALHGNEIPGITILENEDPFEVEEHGNKTLEGGEYICQAIAAASPANPFETGHKLLADMKQAMFLADRQETERLDGLESVLRYRGRKVFQREPGEKHTYANLIIAVEHIESRGDPTKP